ncbi:MAG: flagellar biosynthetic protein FliO [Butyrivibrio sp.]
MLFCSVSNNPVVQFITVTLIFVFVLAITYFTTRWIGSYQKKQMSLGNIKIIESYRLSSNKILEIVKAGNKCFLIAVCKDTVTLIGEVDEETLELKETADKSESFGTVFSRFKIQHKDETDDGQETKDPFQNN